MPALQGDLVLATVLSDRDFSGSSRGSQIDCILYLSACRSTLAFSMNRVAVNPLTDVEQRYLKSIVLKDSASLVHLFDTTFKLDRSKWSYTLEKVCHAWIINESSGCHSRSFVSY